VGPSFEKFDLEDTQPSDLKGTLNLYSLALKLGVINGPSIRHTYKDFNTETPYISGSAYMTYFIITHLHGDILQAGRGGSGFGFTQGIDIVNSYVPTDRYHRLGLSLR
jgi:hypothetical protein